MLELTSSIILPVISDMVALKYHAADLWLGHRNIIAQIVSLLRLVAG